MSGRVTYWLARPGNLLRRALRAALRPIVLDIINNEIRVWGDRSRVHIARSAYMVNALFNVSSGTITVGEHTFAGHNVSLITGTHDYNAFLEQRRVDVPRSGRDIEIGAGVWIGSNALILGPCRIGDHAVIAAGAVVTGDVAAYTIVAGVPAKPIRQLRPLQEAG
jgi:acetyltransferase-like isoleucine patch superfamily enzyme